MDEVRLQKYLAENGVASRRKCEEYIQEGLVKVNGVITCKLGTKINPKKDIVTFKDKEIKTSDEKHVYILLNKPIGYVTTTKEQFNRETVLDLININKRIVPVRKIRYVYIRRINTYR